MSLMGDNINDEDSERKLKDLGSDSVERTVLVGSEENEGIPSIFLCHHSSGVLGADSERLSKRAQNVEGKRCFESELKETKHRIFLSHSGQQKDFVEQLCVDLEKKGYLFPFFDQRSHSLPKGKGFASLILEAARNCHVAVIVLSEMFMVSKWPMIELVTFYEAQKGENPGLMLMPVFYKLSIDDLKDQSNIDRWMLKWREHESANRERINANKWREVVHALIGLNGFIFEQSDIPKAQKSTGVIYRSEVGYRRAIELEILKMSPPNFLFGSSRAVVGFDRLCEMLSRQFVEVSATGLLLLGLYGIPGLGKTTMLESLCDYFRCKLGIKVCYVDLDDSSKSQVERQKVVLKELCEFEHEALRDLRNDKQGWNLIKQFVGQDEKHRFPVFLALDNVTDVSQKEARAYLEAGFCPGSRIMFTSRSEAILKELLSEERFCKPVPELTKTEAKTITLEICSQTNLSTLTFAQDQALELCLEKCQFPTDAGGYHYNCQKQYHPFALKALANCFRMSGINQKALWFSEEDLIEEFDRDPRADLFKIMESQFKCLGPREQLYFLDVAVFGVEWVKYACKLGEILVPTTEDWIYWLAELHNAEKKSVKKTLKQLERFGMIKLQYGIGGMTMHQLYREFAVWFVTEEISFSKNEWLTRNRRRMVEFKSRYIPRDEMKQWKSLVLLQLISCTELRELDLDKLDRLRHLELQELKNLEELVLPSKNDSMRVLWLSDLDSLKLIDIGSCESLQVIVITRCSNLRRPLGIERCSELKTLATDIHLYPLRDIISAVAIGKSLRDLYLSSFPSKNDELNLQDLRSCGQLMRLTLDGLLSGRVQGLEQVTSLYQLTLLDCRLTMAPEISPNTRVHIKEPTVEYWVQWAGTEQFCRQLLSLFFRGEWFRRDFANRNLIDHDAVDRTLSPELQRLQLEFPPLRANDLSPLNWRGRLWVRNLPYAAHAFGADPISGYPFGTPRFGGDLATIRTCFFCGGLHSGSWSSLRYKQGILD